MRTSLKLFRILFIWGMVPLIVWSGFPIVGCACTTATAETTCGCCTEVSDSTTECCCCCGAKTADEASDAASVKPLLQNELGLLIRCTCGQTASRALVSLEGERKSAADDLLSQDAAVLEAFAQDPPLQKTVFESSRPSAHADRVVLFHAFLI